MLSTSVSLDTHGLLSVDSLDWLQRAVNIGQTGVGGHLYAKYFPGNVLGAAMIYRIAAVPGDSAYVWGNPLFGYHELAPSASGVHWALRLNALLGALAMTMLLMLAWRLYGAPAALLSVALVGLGTDWFYQSRGFLSEIGAGAGLMAAFYFGQRQRPYACSAAIGLSLLFRPTNVLAIPSWFYAMRGARQRAVGSAAFILLALGVLAYYNWIRFGTILDFGYGAEGFGGSLPIGLFGVLLSPGRSIFFYSPIFILLFSGAGLLLARDRALAYLVLATAAAYVLAAAGWDAWWGGRVWGSRLLTPILPILGVPVASLANRALQVHPPRLVWTMLLLGVLGLGIQLLSLSENPIAVLDRDLAAGYATYGESIMSPSKNALALQLRNLSSTGPCTIDAYSVRGMFPACK